MAAGVRSYIPGCQEQWPSASGLRRIACASSGSPTLERLAEDCLTAAIPLARPPARWPSASRVRSCRTGSRVVRRCRWSGSRAGAAVLPIMPALMQRGVETGAVAAAGSETGCEAVGWPEPSRPWSDLLGGLRHGFRHPHLLRLYLGSRSSPLRFALDVLARSGLALTVNDRRLRGLHGRHAGRPCFVIGNGPSLLLEDLERLQGQVTIASNRIYVAFPEVSWRPTYYTVIDRIYADHSAEEIDRLELVKIFPRFLRPSLQRLPAAAGKGEELYFRPLRHRFDGKGRLLPGFSADAMVGFFPGVSVTILNLQLACYLGCNPIYVIGLDGAYSAPALTSRHPRFGTVAISSGERDHFHPDYRKPGEAFQPPLRDAMRRGYRCCARVLKERGVAVFNASRRTVVDAFPRIDLDAVLTGLNTGA